MTKRINGSLFETTAIKAVEQTDNVSHQANTSADEYASKLASFVLENGTTVTGGALRLLKDAIMHPSFKLYLGGSFFTSFEANSLATMVQKVNKVYFGSNPAMLRGTLIHLGRELALKHKIQTGELLPFMDCIKAIRKELENKFQFMQPKYVGTITKGELFLEVSRAFRVYYKNYLVEAKDFEVECSYNIRFPLEIFNNPAHSKHFLGSGTFDGLAKRVVDDKEIYIMVDAKTTTSPISASVEMDEKLEKFIEQKKLLQTALKEEQKILKKFVNANEKLSEAKTTLQEIEVKLEDATANSKATLNLEKRVKKWEEEVKKWENNLLNFEKSQKTAALIEAEISELNELIEPLMKDYLLEKEAAALKECRKKHEAQLAYYAILESFKTGRIVSRLRVENVVCKKAKSGEKYYNKPEVQVFEWDLTPEALAETEEKVVTLIKAVGAVLDGLDPMVVFRPNKTTFYGSEFNELLEEVKEMVQIKKAEDK
ncbi:hypothetical protein [Sulfurimonas indica]|uniref:hypothetical protein n=1 Tax=Sulfurimonas indica TaxID=2508707 RepID=UPI0012659EEA|nr:hypothetical protein [Sulfurimonas indica]